MTVNDAITKLKVMLGAETEEVVVVENKFAEATLVDGTIVFTDGELVEGATLLVQTAEGEEPLAAPAGLHETTDGLVITVGENGEVVSIEETGAEVEASEDKKEEVEMEEEVTEEKEEFDAEGMLAGIAEMILPYTDQLTKIKEELSSLEARFNDVADEPAAKKVRNTFSEEAQNRATTTEARLDRLVSLRKGRK